MPDEEPGFQPPQTVEQQEEQPPRDEREDQRMDEEAPLPTLPETPARILKKIPISSSHILNVQYDDEVGEMTVEFQNGSRYRYSNVDPTVFTAFMDSPSKGNYLHKVIRQACPCVKMEP